MRSPRSTSPRFSALSTMVPGKQAVDRYLKTTSGPGSFPRPSISSAWGWIDLPGRGSPGEAAIQTMHGYCQSEQPGCIVFIENSQATIQMSVYIYTHIYIEQMYHHVPLAIVRSSSSSPEVAMHLFVSYCFQKNFLLTF